MADASLCDKEKNKIETDNNNNDWPEICPYPGGKARSDVWKYFGFYKSKVGPPVKENLDMDYAVCRLCRKKYANKGNTTNLLFHISHDHKTEGNVVREHPQGHKKPMVQMKINLQHLNQPFQGRLSTDKTKMIDNALLQLLVDKVLPLSLVEHPKFLEFVKLLEPRYKVSGRGPIVNALKKKKQEMTEKLKEELSKSPDVTITHDGWTSCNTESYDTVTSHFINQNWELKSAVLQTRKVEGSHTGENIAASLTATKEEWNLPTPTAISDNAANEKKAFSNLGWNRFGCYGHRINLIVKRSLETPEVARLVGKGRKLVTFFHQSTSANDKLMDKQKLLYTNTPQIIGHKLIMDCPTRWNSTLGMLRRLSEQSAAILALAADQSLSKTACDTVKLYSYTFEEQTNTEHLIEVLQPFEKCTTILCAEKAPTMNKVLPALEKVKKCIQVKDCTPDMIKRVIQKMNDEITNRTQLEEEPLLAAVLNPDSKDLRFMSNEVKQKAHTLLLQKALEINNAPVIKIEGQEAQTATLNNPPLPQLEEDDDNVEPPRKQVKIEIKCVDTDDWLDDVCCTGESVEPVQCVIEKEVSRYLGSTREASDSNLNLLQWWKKNETFYPRLSILAKKYLAMPASSVPSERVFSLAGTLVSKI